MVNKDVKFKTRYTHKSDKGTSFPKGDDKSLSRTQQHFRKEANINSIVAKYRTSGLLTNPMHKATLYPEFGDFSNVTDFQTMQNKMIEINDYFMSLPANIRKEFDNSPQKLMAFMSDEQNIDKARELGLVAKDLSQLKYIKTLDDGTEVDITEEVIKNRGYFVDGKRVNKNGTLYQEVSEKQETPEADGEGGNS
jgi:phage internal scaffolding protein